MPFSIFNFPSIGSTKNGNLRRPRASISAARFICRRLRATTTVTDNEDDELRVQNKDRFASLSEAEATRYLEAVAAGEMTIEQVDAELR